MDSIYSLAFSESSIESNVTVNQRALIDKVLARYSSESTYLREIIQNADDSGAHSVCVELHTDGVVDLAKLDSTKISRIVISNDGEPFQDVDWKRLQSIAEGNPDDTKIGAFGVGFYSVFSICEEPYVVQIYW